MGNESLLTLVRVSTHRSSKLTDRVKTLLGTTRGSEFTCFLLLLVCLGVVVDVKSLGISGEQVLVEFEELLLSNGLE
jgi:hypothetical protein